MTVAASPPGRPDRRRVLDAWQLCAAAPGHHDGPQAADADPAAEWIEAPLGTVASMLAQAGRWHPDEPSPRLDAFDWWLRGRVELDAGECASAGSLRLDGLGGLVDVWVNGQPALHSDNMFVAHDVAWQPMLRPGTNVVHLRVASLDAALQARRPRPRWRTPMVEHQQLRWFRQTLLGRTPGWSPAAPPLGAWRDIAFGAPAGLQVDTLSVTLDDAGTGWVHVAGHGDEALRGVTLELAGAGATHRVALQPDAGRPGRWEGRLVVAQPRLWWPHTHGEPALYGAALVLERQGDGAAQRQPLPAVGFRRIEVDTADGDFALRVNGVPVFCRGACWMPLDPIGYRPPPGVVAAALARVREAGMNMLRLSGTTVYESDEFLDACDAAGVLVWQEFMFASMDYPGEDPAFAASVRAEAAQLLARWQGRPSLAVLCGNSEGGQQAAMWGAPRELWAPPLFHETLAAQARQARPDVAYWPSSAHGGALPHQSDAGTSSYYGVGAYLRPPEDARRAAVRFATECLALANVPEPATIRRLPQGEAVRVHHPAWKARVPRDLGAGWDFEDVRDHYLRELFGVDPLRCRYADHDHYLALSRAVSAELMAGAFAEWRRPGSVTRGALVWTLRDLRAGAGWGLLDERGDPKACWHALRRVLQPTVALLTDEGGNGLVAHLVHEAPQALDVVLRVRLFAPGDAVVGQAELALHLDARSAQSLPLAALFDGFYDLTYSYRFGPPAVALVHLQLDDAGGRRLGEAFHRPAGRAVERAPDTPLASAALARRADGTLVVRVQARRWAQSVAIEIDGHEPEDNHFHLAPGDAREIEVRGGGGAPRGWVRALNGAQALALRLDA